MSRSHPNPRGRAATPLPASRPGALRPARRRAPFALVWLLAASLGLGCEVVLTGTNDPFDDGAPVASFTESETRGAPGLVVRFTSTATGEITSWAWDFGALGTSAEQNPSVTYPAEGTYSVSLTVRGPSGTSTVEKTDLIEIGAAVVGGFTCAPVIGYAPLPVTCTDESQNADTWLWDFGDTTGSSTAQSPTYEYTTAGAFTVRQTASGPAGAVETTGRVDVGLLTLTPDTPPGGPTPATVRFTADTGGLFANSYTFVVDGVIVQQGPVATLDYTFLQPGAYLVRVTAFDLRPTGPGNPGTGVGDQVELTYTVGYGQATANFMPLVSEGTGPLDVPFVDLSAGQVDRWEWDFGDGTGCVFPDQAGDPAFDLVPVCSSASPSRLYGAVGSYDVTLRVTGPGPTPSDPPVSDTFTWPDAVRVTIVDPSFEQQAVDTVIDGDWVHRPPLGGAQTPLHFVRGGGDLGMPTDGAQWAVLEAIETDGLTPVETLDNGIQQVFILPRTATVLEFDYALLFNEPPASGRADRVVATVSLGGTSVEMTSARADTTAAYAGESSRFSPREGNVLRGTPPRTASLDVAQAFPAAPPLSRYTLTIRVGNADDGFRSPLAYVDHVRFVDPSPDAVAADFTLPPAPVVAGRSVTFTDATCVGTAPGCPSATSWRWDFGTGALTTPPPSSGSSATDPGYVFPAAGTYTVSLTARFADREDTIASVVDVIGPPVAGFVITSPAAPPYTAPETLTFGDTSTADASDPIVAWAWDFGGWGSSTSSSPAPVSFPQSGTYTVTLTVTTASGETSSFQTPVTLD